MNDEANIMANCLVNFPIAEITSCTVDLMEQLISSNLIGQYGTTVPVSYIP